MVIEDDTAVRHLIAEILRDAGHGVLECDSAEDALSSLDSAHPDLIGLDLALPFMDGLEFLRLLRSRRDTAHVPVLAISAAPQDLLFQLSDEVQGIIAKPFHLDQLLDSVARALNLPEPA